MSWLILLCAALFEIVWVICLKYSHGFTRLLPSIGTICGMLVSFYLLSLAMKNLPMGTAYAVWTGIGSLGVALIGIFFFSESLNFIRVISLLFIIIGIVGLKMSQ